MPLRYLFVDMNSFFASVEQQLDPRLRGRPVGVIPVAADSTCCIAASVEAKTFGVRTGTPVWEARRLCPGIRLVVARHDQYVRAHEAIVDAVGRCVPVTAVMSIDEMACKLLGAERDPANAAALGRKIKVAIRDRAGDYLKCSVGIGPSVMLAKVAGDLQKPDGLTVIHPDDLPGRLHALALTDFPGIGPRMEKRFHKFGVFTVERLLALTAPQMCTVWGSKVHGWRWWYLLRGHDVPTKAAVTRTVGHSHILPPKYRTRAGAWGVLVRLIHKAAARLRKMKYWAGGLAVTVNFVGDPDGPWGGGGWAAGTRVPRCQDTVTFLEEAAALWAGQPEGTPLRVGVVFTDLVPARSATPSLFDTDRKRLAASAAMDTANRAVGPNAVHFGGLLGAAETSPMRVSFTHIPDEETESNETPRTHGWAGWS